MRSSICIMIPARLASTRLPDKPLAEIGGVPMILHTLRRAQQSGYPVYVVSSDAAIIDRVRSEGYEAIATEGAYESGTLRCAAAVDRLSAAYAHIINVQGDEPLIDPDLIRAIGDRLGASDAPEMVTAVYRVPRGESWQSESVSVIPDVQQRALYFSRARIPVQRDIPMELWTHHYDYLEHIGIYGFTRAAIQEYAALAPSALEQVEKLEQLRWLDAGRQIHLVYAQQRSLSVDTPSDLEQLRRIIE